MFETLLAEELLVYVVEESVAEMVEIFLVEKLVVEADVQALSFYSVLYKKSDCQNHRITDWAMWTLYIHTNSITSSRGVCLHMRQSSGNEPSSEQLGQHGSN